MLRLTVTTGMWYFLAYEELKNRILMVTDEGSELDEDSTRALIENVN